MISVTFTNDCAKGMIDDLKFIFPSLLAGAGLPPMVEQPPREPAPAETKTRKPRTPKEEAKADAGESGATEQKDSTKTASTETSGGATTETAEIPDIELVRAKLKQMGATDGLGHDKVFEVLGKYKATNASSVPTEKRADLIAEIDTLLAGVAK